MDQEQGQHADQELGVATRICLKVVDVTIGAYCSTIG